MISYQFALLLRHRLTAPTCYSTSAFPRVVRRLTSRWGHPASTRSTRNRARSRSSCRRSSTSGSGKTTCNSCRSGTVISRHTPNRRSVSCIRCHQLPESRITVCISISLLKLNASECMLKINFFYIHHIDQRARDHVDSLNSPVPLYMVYKTCLCNVGIVPRQCIVR